MAQDERSQVMVPVDALRRAWAAHHVYVTMPQREELRDLLKRPGVPPEALDGAARELRRAAALDGILVRALLRAKGRKLPARTRYACYRTGWMLPALPSSHFGPCPHCGASMTARAGDGVHTFPLGEYKVVRVELCGAKSRTVKARPPAPTAGVVEEVAAHA